MKLTPQTTDREKKSELIDIIKFKDLEPVEMDFHISSQKDKIKCIKMIERYVRASLEYKDYIKYLKDYIDMTRCSFFGNVQTSNYSKISIEIHHSPLTLFDITLIILTKHEDLYGGIDLLEIAEEVMKVHYQCRVGLIPLSKTCHQLVHNGQLFIPIQMVRGNWIEFYKEYQDQFKKLPDVEDKIKKVLKYSKQVNDISILDTKYTYVNVDGFNLPQIAGEEENLKLLVNN